MILSYNDFLGDHQTKSSFYEENPEDVEADASNTALNFDALPSSFINT